jgi:hypothetical protein
MTTKIDVEAAEALLKNVLVHATERQNAVNTVRTVARVLEHCGMPSRFDLLHVALTLVTAQLASPGMAGALDAVLMDIKRLCGLPDRPPEQMLPAIAMEMQREVSLGKL